MKQNKNHVQNKKRQKKQERKARIYLNINVIIPILEEHLLGL